MGNVLDVPKSTGDLHAEDLSWLSVPNSAIFNDSYVAETYESLPPFKGTEISQEDEVVTENDEEKSSIRIKRLVEIFSKSKNAVTYVENFEELSCAKELENSPFAQSNKMRSRLLQRIHLAMLRSATRSPMSSGGSTSETFVRSLQCDNFDDADGLLTATSIRMSLAIMQCLAPTNPPLFKSMSASIMDLLSRSSSLGLASVEDSSPQGEGLRAIIEFAQETASQSSANRSDALALLLAVAVTSGSLSGLIAVVSNLKRGSDRLPTSVTPFMQRLEQRETTLDLSIPMEDTISGDINVKMVFDFPDADKRKCEASFTTDGTHLFIWNSISCAIHKIGTGFHGTIAGNEYLTNALVEQQIRDRLGMMVYEPQPRENSSAETAPEPESVGDTHLVRVIDSARQITIDEHLDVDDCLSEFFAHEEFDELLNFVGPILEERVVYVLEFDRSIRFFRIGEREWISEENPVNDESDVDDDDDDFDSESRVVGFTRAVDVITNTSGGQEAASSETMNRDVEETEKIKPAWISWAHGKIYLRMCYLLGPFRIAVFSASALKLEDIIDLDLPVPLLIKTKRSWLKKMAVQLREGMLVDIEESKEDIVHHDEKLCDALDAVDIDLNMLEEDEGEKEIWEDGEQVDLLHSVLVGNEDFSRPSIATASSNFMSSGGEQERNLLAADDEWNIESSFQFGPGDTNQEIILDMGGQFRVTEIGASFDIPDGSHSFEVHVSSDGNSYELFGSIIPSTVPAMLHYSQSDEQQDSISTLPNVRYIRYTFGGHSPDGNGLVIHRLYVRGPNKVRKDFVPPFPVMTSDGRNLIFLHMDKRCILGDGGNEEEHILQSFVFDPCVGMKANQCKQTDYKWGLSGGENELQQCSFLFNSSNLIVSHTKKFARISKDDKQTTFCFWKFDTANGKLLSSTECNFSKSKGYPCSLSYDSRNNMIWAWNWADVMCLRWRNNGLAPRFDPPKPISARELLLSTSPHHRLEALYSIPEEQRDSAYEASFIMCQLDRLALLYSPPRESVAEAKKFNELEVQSAGADDGNFCKLLVRGQVHGSYGRGFNILVLDNHFVPKDFRNFDTHDNMSASERMADFVDTIPENRLVLVATMDTAVNNLTSRGKASLRSLGAGSHIERLPCKGSFAMIGRKGASPSEVVQQVADRKAGAVVVRQRMPSPKVPLAVECSSPAIHGLVELVRNHHELIKKSVASPMDVLLLISSMRLLSTNVHQLLCGSSISDATRVFDVNDRKIIVKIVNDFIDQPPAVEGGAVIAETALQLYITSIDVLYPSPNEKCSLLVKYLDEFVNGTLSDLEGSVLELLLRQMSDATSLGKLFEHTEGSAVANPDQLLSSLLSISKVETLSRLKAVSKVDSVSTTLGNGVAGVGNAAVLMLATLCNMILSKCAQTIIVSDDKDLVEINANSIMSLISNIADSSSIILQAGFETNRSLCGLHDNSNSMVLDDEIDEILKLSFVGELLPTVLHASGLLFESHGSKLTSHFSDTFSESLTSCLKDVHSLLATVPKIKLQPQGATESGVRTSTHTYESAHPYLPNTDEKFELNFPNAIRMTIAFDQDTRTENNYDYVRIWKDSSKTESCHPGIDKLTGRNGSENWPGQGDRPPLVIEGGECYVEWHSDSSNEDWGWRFNVVVEFRRRASTQSHWLVDIEKQICFCGAEAATSMIISTPWNKEKEDRNAFWMEDSLLDFGFLEESEVDMENDEEAQFLNDFEIRPSGSLASALCKIMKTHVREDQGQVEDINCAVYATCAALLKHNNLVAEALALAKDNRQKPSDLLIKVWTTGQKMKTFFAFGDVRDASKAEANDPDLDDLPPPPTMERGPSIYSGADAEVVRKTSEEVVKRAKFLLRVNSSSKAAAVAKESAKRKWELLSKSVIHRGRSRDESDGDIGGKWHALVGEVHAAYKLKGMLTHMRKEASLRKGGAALTTTEKVLRFVQGRVNVADLESIRTLRNARAHVRSCGFDMISRLIEAAISPFAIKWLMCTLSNAIRSSKRPDCAKPGVHYLNTIEGCSNAERGAVIKSFCGIVEKCVNMMGIAYANSNKNELTEHERNEWRSATISCIRALAIDYNLLDHSILDSCNILAELQYFLQASEFDVQRTGWSLFELLLPRCVGLEGHRHGSNSISDEPTDFSKKLVAMLVNQLDRAACRISALPTPENTDLALALGGNSVIPGVVSLRRDSLGYCAPHQPLGLYHTFSFWMKRKKCAMDSAFESGEIAEGYKVFRGPNWRKGNIDDGGDGCLGTVVKVDGDKVTVKWENKIQAKYKFGAIEDGEKVYEVSVVDTTVGGHILSKGMNALLSEDDAADVWSTFGICLRPNATLKMFAASGGDDFYGSVGKNIIPAEEWTHVAVVQDKDKNKIYINGTMDCENTIPGHMLYPGKGSRNVVVVESPHPYRDNTELYTVIQEEGAVSYTITFDPRTRTESNYDYIRFYKNDSHSDYWGEQKYTGGRGGSSSNWPGFNGRPPLVIPAARFIIYFKTDCSNNDWGYKMNISVEKLEVVDDERDIIDTLNDKPIYIGQMPSYVNNLPNLPNSFDGLIGGLSVYPRVLSGDEIASLATHTPESPTDSGDEVLCLDVLSMMDRSCQALKGISATMSNAFPGPNVVYPLLCIVSKGTAFVQSSALRVCATLLPVCPIELVNVQATRAGLSKNGSFLNFILNRVGQTMNVWSRYSVQPPEARLCNELEFSIGMEYLNLLNALAVSEEWGSTILSTVDEIISTTSPATIASIKKCTEKETALGKSSSNIEVQDEDLNLVFSILGLLGGTLSGLYAGAKARYATGDDNGIMEECTVLASTWPPDPSSFNDKVDAAMWKDMTSFGDAFVIVLNSQPGESLVVPRNKLSVSSTPFCKDMSSFLSKLSGSLVNLFSVICNIDATDKRPVHIPKIKESDECHEFESPHPYPDNSEVYKEIKFPGAKSIIIEFDRRTRTEPSCDYVRFYKDNNHRDYFGDEKYHGRDNEQNWPGVAGRPPLVIPGDSCVLYFHSDGSNNDWGYKFTAKAHCIVKTFPPPRPPLLHNALIAHVKLLGVNALHTLLKEFSWFSLSCMPIMSSLLSAALSPLPVSKVGPVATKPLVFESKHPYDHNLDDYIPVRIAGAKKLIVTFDDQTATENSCDYMRLYKDDSKSEYWGENQYTGGKDGGSCNWPGIQDRPPLIIPSDSFIIYFHTDSSVNAWGWKMFVSAAVDESGGSTPEMDTGLCLYRAQCCQMVLRDCPARQPEPEGLDEFEVETPSAGELLLLDISNEIVEDAAYSTAVEADDTPPVTPLDRIKCNMDTIMNVRARGGALWPRDFKMNPKDTTQVIIRSDTADEADIVTVVTGGCVLTAEGEHGDWLRVKATENDDVKEGWARRRVGDLQYLLPVVDGSVNESLESDDIIILPSEDDSSGIGSRHSMYDVDESTLSSVYGKHDIQPTPLELLQPCADCIERTAADMCQIGAVCVAQDCVSRIVSIWPDDIPFTMQSFGNTGRLLAYIRAAFIRESSMGSGTFSGPNSALGVLKNRILEVVRKESEGTEVSDDPPLADTVMKYAVKQLAESLRLETALRPVRAKVKTLECKHPYDDNMDEYWDLSIPGAKWMKIVFDKRTSTEKDCDYLTVYHDQSRTQTYGPRYTGRASGNDKTWPGLGSTPPLIIPADSCVVHFHSDSSNVDWGFLLRCYGIIDEPTEEEKEKVKAEKTSPNAPIPELACWLLEFLAKEPVEGVYRILYAPSTIATLRRYVEIMPTEKKLFAVNLLTNMVQEITRVPVTQETVDEIFLLKKVIVDLSSKQHALEAAGGGSPNEVSQLLQALIQAAIVLDSSVASLQVDRSSIEVFSSPKKRGDVDGTSVNESKEEKILYEHKDNDDMVEHVGWNSDALGKNLELADSNRTVRRRPFVVSGEYTSALCNGGFQSGTHTSHVKLNFISGAGPIVGVAVRNYTVDKPIGDTGELFSIGWGSQKLHVSCRDDPIPFGPKFSIGDVISVEVDRSRMTVTFFRNHAIVGIAVGPTGSGAVVEMPLPSDQPLHLAVSLGNTGDSLQYVESIPPVIAPITTVSALTSASSDMPDWFLPIREAVMLLRSCSARELPASVFSREFVPMCEEKAQVVIESTHPFNSAPLQRTIVIPGAESLTVRFDSATKMGTRDIIRIQGPLIRGERQKFEYTGLVGGSVVSKSAVNTISVSDKVVRGPTWDWGDQDGGPGSYGEVLEVTTWKGKPNAGVTVKWKDTDFVGLYRWDFEGFFDLLVVGQSEKSMNPLNISGDTLDIEVQPSCDESSTLRIPKVEWAGALYFNGTSSHIEIPSSNDIELTSDLTVEAWIKVATNIPSTVDFLPVLTRQIELDGIKSQFSLQLGFPGECGTNTLVMHATNVEIQPAIHVHGGNITPGLWTHIACVVMGSVSALFVNGTLVGSTNTITGTRLGALGAPLYVGKSADSRFFKGNIYDIRIFNIGRSIDVIQAEKGTPPAADTPGLISHLGTHQSSVTDLVFDAVRSETPLAAPDVMWDSAVEPNVLPAGANYGYKCIVTPTFSLNTVLHSDMFQDILHSLQNQYTVGEFRHDLALVRYINQVSRARKINIAQLLVCKWSDIAPTEGELSSMPLLKDLIHMVDSRVSLHGGEEESKNSTDGHNMPMCAPPVHTPTEGSETVLRPIEARFKLLQLLNKALSTTVPFFDLCTVDKPWSVASLLSACRGLVFEATKQPIWDAGMAATNCSNSSTFDLKLSRSRAAKFHRTGQVDNEGRWMVFSQAFRVLHTMPPSALRRSDKVYNCTFMGERAHDAGGPYRESYAMMALELQSHALPLLIRTPNSRHNVGQNREKWVLNPGATSSLHMDMFCFLGKLMGIAVRTKEYLALDIPSIIWKLLVNETPTREDLEGIDLFKVQSLDKMRNIHLHQVDASTFSSVFYETFTTVTTDARTVELLPGGAEKDLTFENRDYYCDLIEHYRLHEFDAQAAAVRRGLAAMLPYRLLSLFTWDQLEEMVCGRPIIDVALLRSVTEYSSCSSTDEHVQYFWQAMEEFTNEERSIFIRFTWGRSRLPLTADAFPQRFKLQSFGKSPPDAYLPVAHTCFFSLELPRYSTLEIMKEKLRYAIFNCQAIDGDDTSVGMQAASMGWED